MNPSGLVIAGHPWTVWLGWVWAISTVSLAVWIQLPSTFSKMWTALRRGPAVGSSGAPTAMIWPLTATE